MPPLFLFFFRFRLSWGTKTSSVPIDGHCLASVSLFPYTAEVISLETGVEGGQKPQACRSHDLREISSRPGAFTAHRGNKQQTQTSGRQGIGDFQDHSGALNMNLILERVDSL